MANEQLSRRQHRLREQGEDGQSAAGTPGKATLCEQLPARLPHSPREQAQSLIGEVEDRASALDEAIQARDFDAADRASCVVDRLVQALSNELERAGDPELDREAAPLLARLEELMPLAPEPRKPYELDRSRRQSDWYARVGGSGAAGGQGLPAPLRDKLERTLGGTALDQVRLHTDAAAQTAAASLGARAYTVGQDIYFGAGEFAPEKPEGQHLIAHEVAHTVQQRGDAGQTGQGAGENEAEGFAQAFSRGETATIGEAVAPAAQPFIGPIVVALVLDDAGAFDPIKDAIQRGSAEALRAMVDSGAELIALLRKAGSLAKDVLRLIAEASLDLLVDAIRLTSDSKIIHMIFEVLGLEQLKLVMDLLIDYGHKVVSKVLHLMSDSPLFYHLAEVVVTLPFEALHAIMRHLGAPVLKLLWLIFRRHVLRYILDLLDHHWPVGKGIAILGHVGATFGYPIYLGADREVSVSRPDQTNLSLYRRGELTAAADTGASAGMYLGTKNAGIGAQVGANAQAGYKATLVQDFQFPVFEEPDTFVTLVLAFLMLEHAFVAQIGEMLVGGIPDPMLYNTRTQFEVKAFAKVTGEAEAGITEPGANTPRGAQKGDSAPDIGKKSWLLKMFGMQASILGEAGAEAGVGCEVKQDWSGVTDRSAGPKRATLSVFVEAEAGLKLLHSLPFIPQLPALTGGVGVRLNYAATPDEELHYENMELYVKQGDLDRYDGPGGEASLEVTPDMLGDLVRDRGKFLDELADKTVTVRRRFGVATGTGQSWLRRSRSGLRSLLPNSTKSAFTLEGYLTVAAVMTGADAKALLERAIKSARKMKGRDFAELVADLMKFLTTGTVPKKLRGELDAIASALAPHVQEVKLHGRSGLEVGAGAHVAEGAKARVDVRAGAYVTVDKDLLSELRPIDASELLEILHEEVTDGILEMTVGDDGLPIPAR